MTKKINRYANAAVTLSILGGVLVLASLQIKMFIVGCVGAGCLVWAQSCADKCTNLKNK